MEIFERDILSKLPNSYTNKKSLIHDIAVVHAELLFIHPFREGNGRTARILANLMSRKHGYAPLLFDKVGKKEFEFYVSAIQKAADKEYHQMEQFIELIFAG